MNSTLSSIKQQYNNLSNKLSAFIRLDKNKSAARKIVSSFWAVFFGLMISLVFIGISSRNNPFYFFQKMLDPFKSARETQKFIVYLVIFGFSGLASAVGFKSGLFNIGISGQMMISSTVIYSFFIILNIRELSIGLLLLGLIMSVVAAAIIGMISGLLKAFLNVHEVISTILINWIVAKVNGWLFVYQNSPFGMERAEHYIDVKSGRGIVAGSIRFAGNDPEHMQLIFGIAFLIIFLVLAISLFVIYKNTAMGYKLKMLGLSKTNGEYIGVNEKITTIYVMTFSASLAGVAGFFYYVFNQSLLGASDIAPIAIGFEAIAIALLALNSSIGVIIAGFFYSILYTIRPSLQSFPLYIKPDELPIITSIILYLAAIAQMFLNFKPLKFTYVNINNISSRKFWLLLKLFAAKKKKLKLFTKYSKIKNKVDKNINYYNWDQNIQLYRDSKIKFYSLYLQCAEKINYLESRLILVDKLQKAKADLFFENLVIKNQIKFLKNYKTYQNPANPFASLELIEKQKQIKELEQTLNIFNQNQKEFKELKNKLYSETKHNLLERKNQLQKLTKLFTEDINEINFAQINSQILELENEKEYLKQENILDIQPELFSEKLIELKEQIKQLNENDKVDNFDDFLLNSLEENNEQDTNKENKELKKLTKSFDKLFAVELNNLIKEKNNKINKLNELLIVNYNVDNLSLEQIEEEINQINNELDSLNDSNYFINSENKYYSLELSNLNEEINNFDDQTQLIKELKNQLNLECKDYFNSIQDQVQLKINELKDKKTANTAFYKELLNNYKNNEIISLNEQYQTNLKNLRFIKVKSFDIKQFNRSVLTRKTQIKQLEKDYKIKQNQILSLNKSELSNEEILAFFTEFAEYKKNYLEKLRSLNYDAKKIIKMNYQSELTTIKYEHNEAVKNNNLFVHNSFVKELLCTKAKSKEVESC
ncbi:hypothetical protein [Mycoplasma sp. 1018B]|uniref:ABC transporter permease subunit n=1 Tax=Mycoplasma sp. 1018B TaxID=2967302 RepID=UPI00211C2D42|nr:hypothetical protein [Mycoplasma sp. 1018B]UUM19266.1 hypothetical protein NPA14_00060 [Mycoplasma sp. 1018B]